MGGGGGAAVKESGKSWRCSVAALAAEGCGVVGVGVERDGAAQ